MTGVKIDFPYNLLISVKLGELKYNKDNELIQTIIIKEKLLFKIIKLVRNKWLVV